MNTKTVWAEVTQPKELESSIANMEKTHIENTKLFKQIEESTFLKDLGLSDQFIKEQKASILNTLISGQSYCDRTILCLFP